MTRSIRPVELHESEEKIVSSLQKESKRLTGKKLSVSTVLRRCLQIAGPQMLKGEVPLLEAVNISPASSAKK